MQSLDLKCALVFIGLGLGVSACISAPVNSGYTSFSGYAEAVFRHQNELNSRLMMLHESDQFPENPQLESAEDTLLEACQLLNEYAERESSGESVSWRFQSKVQSSIAGCAASVEHMESLLKNTAK